MKAQILKIAGVKTEAEFYKKFPTEEAFMKKHGKQLEKASNGVSKKFATPEMTFKPVSGSTSPVYDYYNNSNDNGGSMLTTPYQMGQSSNVTTTGENTTMKPLTKAQMAGNILLNQAGSIIGLGQSIADKYGRQTQELDNYTKASAMLTSMPKNKINKTKYVRPEYSQVSDPQKYGVPMAEDGASIGGNPTEIQNTYDPTDIYTDLEYEPLNDSNIKQYAFGGDIANSPVAAAGGGASGGFDASQFMGAAGSLGGALGSLAGGDDFAQTEEGQLGSTLGGAAGTALGGPVGGLIGAGLGGLAGGLIGGKKNKQLKFQKQTLQNNLAAGAYTNALQNGPLSSYAEDGAAIPSYEEGGYMNPEYNPQVIAKFGDFTMNQLLAPPQDADMLRAGGHLKEYTPPSEAAMYTGRDLPYQMEDGGQMAMGGDLQVHWGGNVEEMSYNPYLPGDGITYMPHGQSHDEANSKGQSGIGITYGDKPVEIERNEPMVKLKDGGSSEDDSLFVFGNLLKPGSKQKFKHYVADLSKMEAKQNKLVDKTTSMIDDVDANDQFDKLKLNTGQANLIGTSMKLKEIAQKKMDAAAEQNAILDTAKEFGLESDALAKGKIKYAKANDPYAEFGAKLEKFGPGGKKKAAPKYDPEFENFINPAMMLEQANSSRQVTPSGSTSPVGGVYRGGAYNYGTANADNGAYNTPEKAKEFYYKNYWSKVKDLPAGLRTRALQLAINTGDPYGELMVAAGKMSVKDRAATKDQRKDKVITGNKDWEANKKAILDEYNKDPQGFLGKLDAEQDRYYDSYIANNPLDVNSDTRKDFYNDYVGLAKYASQPYINSAVPGNASPANQPVSSAPSQVPAATIPKKASSSGALTGATPPASSVPASVPANAPKQLWQIPKKERAALAKANGIKNYTGTKAQNMKLLGVINKPAPQPLSSKFLPTPDLNAPAQPYAYPLGEGQDQPTMIPDWMSADATAPVDMSNYVAKQTEAPADTTTGGKKKDRSSAWNNILTGVNSALPFLRPSNQMTLDPSQLSGEMLALATNELEPVYAQTFQPNLSQPFSISLQDMRNQITSESRAAQRLAQNNPAAAAMIASQAAEAKNKVNAEEFRANQGEQARVAELNRATLNDAQMKNLGIFDQQYQRQAQAKSNTKQQAIAALNSMNDKILKNKLENRQLATYENLYNYRFTPNGVAYNINPLAQFNPYGSGASSGLTGKLAPGKDYSLDRAGNIIGVHSVGKDDTAKNGKKISKGDQKNSSIVKAIKNL